MRKTIALLLSLVLLFSMLAGCTPKDGENGDPKTTNNIATYNIGIAPTSGFDVGLGQTTSTVNMFVAMNGYLYRLNLDGEWAPELADGLPEVSPDGLVWTIKLKPDLKFSTGNPITAEDVKYSWLRVLDPELASDYAFIMYYIKGGEAFNSTNPGTPEYEAAKEAVGLKVIDPLTIEITLENPAPFFIQLLGFATYAIVDKQFIEGLIAEGLEYGNSPETTCSSGPFKFTEYKPGEYVMCMKNENYVRADEVKLDGVRFTLIEQSVTELNLWETGEIDVTNHPMSIADMQKYEAEGKLTQVGTLGIAWHAFNCARPPFDDVRVRKALVKALDLKTIVDTVVGGGAAPADGFIPPYMPAVDDPSKPFRTESYIDINGEVEEAKQLLAEAGYPNGEGFPVCKFQYYVSNDQSRALVEAMCAQWKANLGITVEPDGMEAAARLAARQNGDFDICVQGWGADFADPMTFLDCLRSTHYYNYGKWTNAAFDEALENSARELDASERQKYLVEAERILMEEMPIIMTSFSTKTYLQNPRIKDMIMSPMGIADFTWAYIEE